MTIIFFFIIMFFFLKVTYCLSDDYNLSLIPKSTFEEIYISPKKSDFDLMSITIQKDG